MRKIILSLLLLLVVSCNNQQQNFVVTITFPGNVQLPSRLLGSTQYSLYKSLVTQYCQITHLPKIIIPEATGDILTHTSPITQFLNFEKGFALLTHQPMALQGVFNLSEVITFYTQNSVSGPNITLPNIHNVFSVCIVSEDCKLLKSLLNLAGQSSGIILDVSNFQCIGKNETPIILPDPTTPIDINFGTASSYYRTVMNIDSLNNRGILGDSINITTVETSEYIDTTHAKFIDLVNRTKKTTQPLAKRIISIGANLPSANNHATKTWGVLFAKHETTSSNRFANTCKGICPQANLNTTILWGMKKDTPCGVADKAKYALNALLRAINATNTGQILLIEFSIDAGFPVEKDRLANILLTYATKNKGIVIVEPIGNGGVPLDSGRNNINGITFSDAILVGGVKQENGRLIVDSSVSQSSKVTCFGISENVLTTINGGKYDTFGWSSAASATIAGLAACLQGYYFKQKSRYLTPQQMKCLFSNPLNGRPVNGAKATLPDAMLLKRAIDAGQFCK